MKYKQSYRMYWRFSSWGHSWEMVGEAGAIHVHLSTYLTGKDLRLWELSGGIELHYRKPPGHLKDRPPSYTDCPLIGLCWHDGSSLWVTEQIVPNFKLDSDGCIDVRAADHRYVFNRMEEWTSQLEEDYYEK